jgi:hypothetical protein
MSKFVYLLLVLAASLCVSCNLEDGFLDSSSSSQAGSMARFVVKGDYLYVVGNDNLMAVNIDDSTQVRISSNQYIGPGIETLFSYDSLLFMGSTEGMYASSLKQPSKPSLVTMYRHITSYDPVVVRGNYAFVTLRSGLSWNSVNELQVIDIRQLDNPVEVATYPMTSPRGLAVTDSLLFICDNNTLVVMNSLNPLNMNVLHRFTLSGTLNDVIAKGGLLTLSYSGGLAQFTYANDTIRQISTLF